MKSRREKDLQDRVDELQAEVQSLRTQVGAGRGYQTRRHEYMSNRTWMGLPLVHICQGPDPETGKPGVARGVIAIGDVALGIVAIGGFAAGGLCIGGVSLGLIALSGISLGLLAALGGIAVGLVAFGGVAIGGLAVGGVALGYIAIGGGAAGYYAIGGEYSTVRDFSEALRDSLIPGFVRRIIELVWELR